MSGGDDIKISRDNFIRLTVVATLVTIAFALWEAGILPVVTSAHHRESMEHVWKLKQRVLVIETKLGMHHPESE